jgi:hypothetical protein
MQHMAQSSISKAGPPNSTSQSLYNTSGQPPVQTMPRPLVPPSLSLGISKSEPPRAPLAVPNRPPLRPIGGVAPQMSSFDKLVLKLKMTFPDKSR